MFTRRRVLVASVGIMLFVAGSFIGRAQQHSRPDFVITVTVDPAGTLTAECLTGCQFQWTRPVSPERFASGVTGKLIEPCPIGCKANFNGIVVRQDKRAD